MARSGVGWLMPSLLLGTCVALGWFAYQQFQAPPVDPGRSAGSQATAMLPEIPENLTFDMPPAATFSAIVERPLFSPSRRPPPEGAVAIDTSDPTLDITLVGVIISSEERIAILKAKNAAGFLRLGESDTYRGWLLESIEPDRVTFRSGDIEEHIELTYQEPPPAPKPRRKQRQKRNLRSQNQPQQNQNQSQVPAEQPKQSE